MSLADIIAQTGFDRTTARRLIFNLESRHLLKQNLDTKKYTLGMRIFEMGAIVFSSFSLRKSALMPMTQLQNKTGATCLLGVMENEQIIYLDKREGNGMVALSSDIGRIRPITYGMLGRVMMAYLSLKEVELILKKNPLKRYTPNSITDEEILQQRLVQVRNQGYAIEVEEFVEGTMGIATPIRDYTRNVIAALGVALPASKKENQKEISKISDLMMAASAEISKNIGS